MNLEEYFNNLEKFTSVEDIPEIPKTDKEFYDNVIIPNLIRCGAIPKSELQIGKVYLGSCRNTTKAMWVGNHFVYKRHKWGFEFDDEINHFEDADGYDLFIPIAIV